MATNYHLVPRPPVAERPVLDEDQRRVVDHPGGPLLVLAGPGTGKTTTLVEAIVDRVERGADPEQVLALTFSRQAAEQLRDRVTARLGRTLTTTLCSTFHSYAYGLIRRFAPAALYDAPLRLLSAPEQDVVLRELLTVAPESVRWPESLRGALGTRGFAREVQAVLARAREKGYDGEQLFRLGESAGVPELMAAGAFLEQYLTILDHQGATDYSDLIRRAVIEAELHRDELRAELRHVFVDEYQDTDPGQVALLRALAGDGRDLVVVGDPHQSIYSFRGAEVRGILEFPSDFPASDGSPAEVIALRTTRRFGAVLLAATQSVAARLGLPGTIDAGARDAFLHPMATADAAPGLVEVRTYDTDRAEAERLADLLRRAHLEDGVPWDQMAVLVRSGRLTLPPLRRALAGAGVPVEIASDDTPLVREPAVRVLLDGLQVVLHLDQEDRQSSSYVDPQRVHDLLASPLAGMDAVEVRLLSRLLRARDRTEAEREDRAQRSSPDLLRSAVLEPGLLDGLETTHSEAVAKARALALLLRRVREQLLDGASSELLLWELWSASGWPRRVQTALERGGLAARGAHRDLDAVCALFDEAARVQDRRDHTGPENFVAILAAQELPAGTLAPRGIRSGGVRLMTAHRSKGLEWQLVVVAHVQEEGWPDLRRRVTLLQPDRIGEHGIVPATTVRELVAEERRLFYVACTRARERLVVTAVASTDDDGEQASRFLEELGIDEPLHQQGRPVRPLSLAGMVAELRRVAGDDRCAVDLRRAAARRLADLTVRHRVGEVWVPAADPETWWGTRTLTVADEPLREVDRPIPLSASSLTSLAQCPAKWFLESEARGERAATQAQGFGNVVHALADRIGRAELAGVDPAATDLAELMEDVDRVWPELPFRTPWSEGREREQVLAAVTRFLVNVTRAGARELLATEQPIRAEVELPDGQVVTLNGYADRLEVDLEGHVVVIDLKTSKYYPSGDEVKVHPQLGLYQLAVENGAVDELAPGAVTGGAELWQLRHELRTGLRVQSQPPQQPDESGVRPIEGQLMAAASAIRDEQFTARPGGHCEHCDFHALCPAKTSGTVLS